MTAGHPAFFNRVDGHISIANSAALAAAHVDKDTRRPREARSITTPRASRPESCARGANALIKKVIPPPTPSQRRKGIELALADAAKWGLTSVQDNSDWEDFLVYEELECEGKLTTRIAEWLPFRAAP